MTKIYYKKTNGKATDLQWKESPDVDDIIYSGDEMPDIETLHDQSYITARDAEKQQRKDDIATILPDMATVNARVDSLASIPDLKDAIRELFRLANWQHKGTFE